MRPHKNLDLYKKSIDFVTSLYGLMRKFPEGERYGLVSQMKRAAISIPSNIAEGAGRQSQKEFLQFLHVARGSISELDAQLEVSLNLGFISDGEYEEKQILLDDLSRMLSGLIKSIRHKASSKHSTLHVTHYTSREEPST